MFIEHQGIRIHYQLHGPAQAPVVMLAHALATNRELWQRQIEALQADYRVLSYDLRGHGQSSAPNGAYDFSEMVADAVALLDALAIEKAHWVGISLGGMIGQAFALSAPERLASLSLCDTTCAVEKAEAKQAWLDRIATASSKGMKALLAPTIARWFSPDFQVRHPEEILRIEAMIRRTPVAGYCGCCHAIRELDFSARLREILAPTLVMVGECDPGTPVAEAKRLTDAIPSAEMIILPKAFHLSNIEAASEFNHNLLNFLNRQAR